MEHFYTNVNGWFDFESLYSKMVDEAAEGASFVEVGAFYGKSAAFMAVEIINSGKNIDFHVVDTWRGSPEHQDGGFDRQEAMINDTAFDIFTANMSPVAGKYIPHKMPSLEAAALFEDNSLDFVFIDAMHDYEAVKDDINTWYPKVKVGGYIGGHDYGENLPPILAGVYAAVNEVIGKDNITVYHTSWLTKKEV